MTTETITWRSVAESLPDADLTVHVALKGDDEPTWLGFFDGDAWHSIDGMPFAAQVTHYAEMLKGPHP